VNWSQVRTRWPGTGLQPPQPAAVPAAPWDPGGEPVQVRPATPAQFDKVADRERNPVERTINRLKGFRRVATRSEKRDVNYLAMVTIAAIVLLWLE
jgi:transposase